MPVILSLYFYRTLQEKTQKEFQKNSIILSWKDIEDILPS